MRVNRLRLRCARLASQLEAASGYWEGTPARFKGWPAEVVIVVSVLAFLGELFTTRWLTDIVFYTFDDTNRFLLALVLTGCTIGIGVTLGETLYHRRIDPDQDIIQRLSIAGVAVIAVASLATAGALHLEATTGPKAPTLAKALEAATVGIVGVVVLVIPLVVSYHREAWSTASTRWRRTTLHWQLRLAEWRLERAYDERAMLGSEPPDDARS